MQWEKTDSSVNGVVIIFLNLTLKVKATKAKINNWNYIELKISDEQRKPTKMKRTPIKWEEIVENHMLVRGWCSHLGK